MVDVRQIAKLKVIGKIMFSEWIDFGHKDAIYKLKFGWLKFSESGFLSGFWSRGVKMRYNGFLGGEILSPWNQNIWIPRASIKRFHCAHANTRGV